jgi:hypothetical protein
MRTRFTALLACLQQGAFQASRWGGISASVKKTAWFLGHRLRDMMEDNSGLLGGIVEADETYVGGKRKRGQKSRVDDDGDQRKGRGGCPKVVTAVEPGGESPVGTSEHALGADDRHFPVR